MHEYLIENTQVLVERTFSEDEKLIEEILVDYFKEKDLNKTD
jgi:hypothetical protein